MSKNQRKPILEIIAVIYDSRKNKFLACGLYDKESPIRIKLIQFNKPAKLNQAYFENRITEAYNKRANLLATATNSYRLLFGEADGFPNLIADVYDKVLVIKLYGAIWFPHLNSLLPHFIATTNCETVVLRLGRNVQKNANNFGLQDGQVIYGKLDNNVVVFKEHGINFSANVIYGHKTGYFLDHRNNRRKVGLAAKGKTVLDVFSYAGGFSVHALANGAKEVTSLDISAQALEVAQNNGKLNEYSGVHKTFATDAFKGLQELISKNITYDIVVIDPPSFAKSAKEIEKAKNSYTRLAKLGIQLVSKNGLLVLASCSSRVKADEFFQINQEVLSKQHRRFRCIETTYHDEDHPTIPSFPEGSYLKTAYYQID